MLHDYVTVVFCLLLACFKYRDNSGIWNFEQILCIKTDQFSFLFNQGDFDRDVN